jgi:hypothetical protein
VRVGSCRAAGTHSFCRRISRAGLSKSGGQAGQGLPASAGSLGAVSGRARLINLVSWRSVDPIVPSSRPSSSRRWSTSASGFMSCASAAASYLTRCATWCGTWASTPSSAARSCRCWWMKRRLGKEVSGLVGVGSAPQVVAIVSTPLEGVRASGRCTRIGAYQERSPLGVLIWAPLKAYSGLSITVCEIGRWQSSRAVQKWRIERPAPGRGLRPARPLRTVQPHPPGAWVSEHQAAAAACGRG